MVTLEVKQQPGGSQALANLFPAFPRISATRYIMQKNFHAPVDTGGLGGGGWGLKPLSLASQTHFFTSYVDGEKGSFYDGVQKQLLASALQLCDIRACTKLLTQQNKSIMGEFDQTLFFPVRIIDETKSPPPEFLKYKIAIEFHHEPFISIM